MEDRFLCTREHVWRNEDGAVRHPDAFQLPPICDCCDLFECPYCHTLFAVEVSQ